MSKNIGFTRWYDRIPELSQAVRLLEKAPKLFQEAICQSIADYHLHQTENETGLKRVGGQKVLGLMKSKAKRRWYDEDPVTHRAFNRLYMMDDVQRYQVAIKSLISLQALQHLSQRDDFEYRNRYDNLAKKVVVSIFAKHTHDLMDTVQFTINEPVAEPQQPNPIAEFRREQDLGELKAELKMVIQKSAEPSKVSDWGENTVSSSKAYPYGTNQTSTSPLRPRKSRKPFNGTLVESDQGLKVSDKMLLSPSGPNNLL